MNQLALEIKHIFFFLSAVTAIPGFFAAVIGMFTLGRKFDKVFNKAPAGPFDPNLPLFGWFTRTMAYMCCIVQKNKSKKDRFLAPVYKGYDFRGNANLLDKILSYVCVVGLVIGILFSIFWQLASWMLSVV